MAGPVEETGETVRTTVTALSHTPALLALIVLQFVTLGVIAWSNYQRNIYESDLNKLLVSLCRSTSDVLPNEPPVKLACTLGIPDH